MMKQAGTRNTRLFIAKAVVKQTNKNRNNNGMIMHCRNIMVTTIAKRSFVAASSTLKQSIRATASASATPSIATANLKTASAAKAPASLVMLGGGISGLSAAWFTMRRLADEGNAIGRVVLLEKRAVCGGWLQSERRRRGEAHRANATYVEDEGFLFEHGMDDICLNGFFGVSVLLLFDH